MNIRHLYLVILFLMAGCHQVGAAEALPSAPVEKPVEKTELDTQLKINRDALLKGPTEQMQIDAATVLLFNETPAARQILLDTLEQSENQQARAAVCKALTHLRETKKHNDIKNSEVFVLPLLAILQAENSEIAELAAEATAIFDYWQMSLPLERMVSDSTLSVNARLNAVYALALQRDINAVAKLVELLGDPEQRIAQAAELALRDAGIPVVKDTQARRQIIDSLQRKGNEEFLRDLLARNEAKMGELEAERNQWLKLYLSSLDKIYDGINDDKERVDFLSGHLNGEEAVLKLWALEKVSQWRVGTASRLPAELGPVLVGLVSNPDRSVRLRTAKLLSLMGELSSAEKLLAQLKVEEDDEVSRELFVALGAACQYAFSPNSGITIAPGIRNEVLNLASEYLMEQEPVKVRNGAEVIKKLLKQEGLSSQDVDKYLASFVERYQQEKQKNDNGMLCAELLSTMAELCAQGGLPAEQAGEKFGPVFEQALTDTSNLVREAAVDGLINIDKMSALRRLRKDFVNDNSALVRKKVIDLAGEVGGQADLTWLAEKTTNKAENEAAWQAMLNIFKRSDADTLDNWIGRFDVQSVDSGLSEEQMLSFIEIAEQKAESENKPQMMRNVKERLAVLYGKTGSFERAAEYWGQLLQSAENNNEKAEFINQLLTVYLRGQNFKSAKDLVHNYLLEQDLDPNDLIIKSLDSFMNAPPAGADPNALLIELEQLEIPQDRPDWTAQKHSWRQMFTTATEPNDIEGAPADM